MEQERFGNTPTIALINEPHLACVLLLDTSESMSGEKINNLNRAINDFKNKVSSDPIAQKRVDVAIVEFNSDASVVKPFAPIGEMECVTLSTHGVTAMGAGVKLAIDLVKQRKLLYNQLGTRYYKPWIFMITDGLPTDDITEAAELIRIEESKGEHGHLKFFALGVDGYNADTLFYLTNGCRKRRVFELKDHDFAGIFDWLGKSMTVISCSAVGREAPLPMLPQNAGKRDPRDVHDL